MELTLLDANNFFHALKQGCLNLIRQKEQLNQINVFPVADGDTGDNMAATALSIVQNCQPEPELPLTLKRVSDAAINGARGNSGMIFSAFFNGMYQHLPKQPQIDSQAFVDMMQNTMTSVRQSILNPMEGTIITVMDCWAASLKEKLSSSHGIHDLIQSTLTPLKQALKQTEQKLEILKSSGVVDAGALGFLYFVEGFYDFVRQPEKKFDEDFDSSQISIDEGPHVTPNQCPDKRFCTEALLTADFLDKGLLSEYLQAAGNSIVLSGNDQRCRFHIHCDEPAELFQQLTELGQLEQPKVDDMLRQFQTLHDRKHSIALVTDTSMNLPQSFLDEHQIHLIPLQLFLDEHQLLDHYCMPKEAIYSKLKQLKTYPKTSMPNVHKTREKLHQLSEHYSDVLVISLSKALSGTHDHFQLLASEKNNIHVINSKQTAGSLGLLVKYAAELIHQGKAIEEIKNILLEQVKYTRTFVLIDQFDALVRSGRVSTFSAKIATWANIKPLITLNSEGAVEVFEKSFSQQKALQKLIAHTEALHQKSPIQTYSIIHADAEENAHELARRMEELLGFPPLFIEFTSSALGLHVGQGSLALSLLCESRQQTIKKKEDELNAIF